MALTKVQPFNTNSTASFTFGSISSGNINGTNLTSTGNVAFSGANVSLGSVSNLHITGGTADYVLKTDGTGNLSWTAQSGGGGGSPGGSNTQIQYNNTGSFSGSAALTFNDVSNTLTIANLIVSNQSNLGPVSNVKITGGTADYVLKTDGTGNLSWVAQSGGGGGGSSISNGNSNVNIPSANGNINFAAVGNTIMVVTGSGANIAGYTNITGNLTVTGDNVSLGSVSNLHITGGTANYVLKTDGAGNLSWVAQSGGGGGGGSSIVNGNSTVDIPSADGNINLTAVGNSTMVVTGTGANIAGTLYVSGPITGSVVPKVVTIADGTTVTIDADTTELAIQTNTQFAGILTINAPTGTLSQGQKILFRLQSANTQILSWNSVFNGSTDLNLPTQSSGSNKYDYVGFIYNSTAGKWNIIAKNFGF